MYADNIIEVKTEGEIFYGTQASRRRKIKSRYCTKVNGRSTIIGPEYVTIIRPL